MGLELLAPVWTHLTTMQPVKGEGVYLWDADDNRYLDFTSGIGVINTGHCHPRVVKAVQEQAAKLIFGQVNIVIPPTTIALAEELNKVTPPSTNRFFFSNSGAEAVEASVKLARHATGRKNIIVFQGSFHGRTAQTMAMTTSKYIYRYNYQPLPAGVFVAPFPFVYGSGLSQEDATQVALQQLDRVLRGQSSPTETAAIIIEPVLGEGGYIPAPPDFLRALREICDEHGILLILDEVQSGCGRTGQFFAFEHVGIEPDIIVMAKGLGSGLPISAIASCDDLTANWTTGSHGGTYGGGNALVTAGAAETVRVLQDEGLVENAAKMGAYLLGKLNDLKSKYPHMGDVRGQGLMVAVEFSVPNSQGKADKDAAKAVAKACVDRRLLILTCGTYENVIRFIPPLIITQAQLDEGLAIFEEALQSVLETA
ncbi:MAG: aspartate aminotransferase family protein [Anaerolineae bacterium]|nr:aspartate aminotransferase family protein [Anaerolineae bacterium]MDQ7034019.1 aspartate aminotransferase family protein [Anaerolineae bacterium]